MKALILVYVFEVYAWERGRIERTYLFVIVLKYAIIIMGASKDILEKKRLAVKSQRPPAQRVAWILPPSAGKPERKAPPFVENNAV